MKIIRIFIAFVVISLVLGVGSAFNGKSVLEQNKTKTNQIENKEQMKDETFTQTDKNEKSEINSPEEDLSTKTVEKVEVKQETAENEQDVDVPKQVVPEQQQPKENNITNQTKQEEKKELNVWEELGMTEDEYYNKPAWKWAKVDFAIEKYGSEDACFNACVKYGESTGMGFSCSTINSASGRYLGEMIKLF